MGEMGEMKTSRGRLGHYCQFSVVSLPVLEFYSHAFARRLLTVLPTRDAAPSAMFPWPADAGWLALASVT